MKYLFLIRHANAENGRKGKDFLRCLDKQGVLDAQTAGKRFAESGVKLDLILTSAAKRAAHTALIIAETIGFPMRQVVEEQELYLAEAAHLLHVLQSLSDDLGSVILVGHNPGISELANALAETHIDWMPTSGVICLTLDLTSWRDLGVRTGCVSSVV